MSVLQRALVAALALLTLMVEGGESLAKKQTIRVSVLDSAGQPIAQAHVALTGWSSEARSAKSAADGVASFELVGAECILLQAVHAPLECRDYCAETIEGAFTHNKFLGVRLLADAQGLCVLTIRLGPPGSKVTGKITDEDGKPVAGAQVTLRSPFAKNDSLVESLRSISAFDPERLKAVTAADGTYEIPVAPEFYLLDSVQPPAGSSLYPHRFMGGGSELVRHGKTMTKNLTLKLGGVLEVLVLDPEGHPVKGAKATLQALRPSLAPLTETSAGEDGVCRLSAPAAGYVAHIQPPDASAWAPNCSSVIQLERGKVSRTTVKLVVGASLSGRVSTEDGTLLPGCRVGAAREKTDGDGRYAIKGLATGRVWVSARKDMQMLELLDKDRLSVRVVAGGSFVHDLVIKQPRRGTLTGRITDAKGQPVAGASVRFQSYAGRENASWVKTDDLGAYRLEAQPLGAGNLQVDPPEEALLNIVRQQVALETAENTTDLQLPAATVVKLSCVDEQGRPVSGAVLSYADRHQRKDGGFSGGDSATPLSDAQGKIVLRLGHWPQQYAPGDTRQLRLAVREGGWLPQPTEIALATDTCQLLEQKVKLRPGAVLRGIVTDEKGEVQDGVKISCNEGKQRFSIDERKQITDRKGQFEFRNLKSGEYTLGAEIVHIHDRNFLAPESVSIALAGEEIVERNIVLKEGGALRGKVYLPDGTLYPRFECSVHAVPVDKIADKKAYGLGSMGHLDGYSYSVRSLPPGEYQLRVSFSKVERKGGTTSFKHDDSPQHRAPPLRVRVEAGKVLEQDIKLKHVKDAANEDF